MKKQFKKDLIVTLLSVIFYFFFFFIGEKLFNLSEQGVILMFIFWFIVLYSSLWIIKYFLKLKWREKSL